MEPCSAPTIHVIVEGLKLQVRFFSRQSNLLKTVSTQTDDNVDNLWLQNHAI